MGISRKFRKKLKQQLSFIKRRMVKPALPQNRDAKVLVHIGCGEQNGPGFINIDARPFPHVHIITDDISSLVEFKDSEVDLIYMCHVLEHFKEDNLREVLSEMKRILKKGGVLRISVPDFDRLIEVYNGTGMDINAIKYVLMGGQQHKYDLHYSLFNQKHLSELLKEAGFAKIRTWDFNNCEHYHFTDFASKQLSIKGVNYNINLNLEAVC